MVTIAVISNAFYFDSQAYSKVNFQPTANHFLITANLCTFSFSILSSLVRGSLQS